MGCFEGLRREGLNNGGCDEIIIILPFLVNAGLL